MPDEGTTESLLRRIQALEDERDIVRTMYRYAHAQYNGDRAAFLACFSEEAVLVRDQRHGQELHGHGDIGAYYDNITHAPEAYHKHVMIEPVVDLDGDRATVASDFLYVQDRDTGPFISHFGHYDDVFGREPDGRWRFLRRQITTEAVAPGKIGTVRDHPDFRG